MTKVKAVQAVLRSAALSIVAVGALAACGEQPTEVEVPTAPEMEQAQDGNCIVINGMIHCNDG